MKKIVFINEGSREKHLLMKVRERDGDFIDVADADQ